MSSEITIDKILGITISDRKHVNEVQSLYYLQNGLMSLYNNVKPTEVNIVSQNPNGKVSFFLDSFGRVSPEIEAMLPCFFHWFGITICNYARLAGFIVAKENGLIVESDLHPKPNVAKIKLHCDDYIKSLNEIENVLKWRNKVAAHFALTDPRNVDNIATMEASIVYPVSFEVDRFRTGMWIFGRGNDEEFYESEIPQWSLTEVFENCSKRFWPDIVFNE